MRLVLIFLYLHASHISSSQFAIIADKDGYVNIRNTAENKNNIADTLKNGDIVWCSEPEGNWVMVDYIKKGQQETGYLYKDRIKLLSSFDSIPVQKQDIKQIIFKEDSIIITISKEDFVVKYNNIKYATSDNVKYVSMINGKPIWGTDSNIPRSQYKSVKIQSGRKIFALPKKAMENLFEPNFDFSHCYYDRNKDILFISSLNSDGAGSYALLWIIEKGVYKNKIVLTPF